jgi:hypothetical protein
MTIDAAFAALVEANPIPDPRSYAEHKLEPAAFLTATRERTVNMKTIEPESSPKNKNQRRWQPLVAVAAAVVIAIGLVTAIALQRNDDDVANVPAPPFETPEQATDAYYAALNAGDGEAYFSLFADGGSDNALANPRGGVALSDAKVNARVEGMSASGDSFVVGNCVEETELQVKCTVAVDNPIRGMTDGVREWEFSVVLTIDDAGLIQAIDESNFEPQGEIDNVRADAYREWMMENHAELWDEANNGLWGPDPITRSGADIARDKLTAALEFDAQYDG